MTYLDEQFAAEDITTGIASVDEMIDGVKYFKINCADCGAIQTFKLENNKLILIETIHQ